MYELNYDRVIGLGEVEYNVFIKLLEGIELTVEEDQRAEQMLRTLRKTKKIKANRTRVLRARNSFKKKANVRVMPHHSEVDIDIENDSFEECAL